MRRFLSLALPLLVLPACQSSSSYHAGRSTGETVTITDTPSNFLAYTLEGTDSAPHPILPTEVHDVRPRNQSFSSDK